MARGPLRETETSVRIANLRAELEELQHKLLIADSRMNSAKTTLLLHIAKRIKEISYALAEQGHGS